MTITEQIKQKARMISRPLYIFLGKNEFIQLIDEKPPELDISTHDIIIFDLIEIIIVDKKSFLLVVG